jgi:hypothetical protein
MYSNYETQVKNIVEFKMYGRPVIFTEWMARPSGIGFEKELPLFRSEKVASYQWVLVNGRSQCQFP